jgi:hypothetical protein
LRVVAWNDCRKTAKSSFDIGPTFGDQKRLQKTNKIKFDKRSSFAHSRLDLDSMQIPASMRKMLTNGVLVMECDEESRVTTGPWRRDVRSAPSEVDNNDNRANDATPSVDFSNFL